MNLRSYRKILVLYCTHMNHSSRLIINSNTTYESLIKKFNEVTNNTNNMRD